MMEERESNVVQDPSLILLKERVLGNLESEGQQLNIIFLRLLREKEKK